MFWHYTQMKTKSARSIEPDCEHVRERRRKARVKLACFILVRPLEPVSENFESIILTDNSCREGLSFKTDDAVYSERMRLLVTFPYSRCPSAINQDYIAEVVRVNALPGGRYSVAVRILTTAKLSTPQTSNLRSNNVWNALWQRARSDARATKPNYADLVEKSS